MMRKIALFAGLVCLGCTPVIASDAKNVAEGPTTVLEKVAPYPEAHKDQLRHVIFLPTLENEDNAKVEINMGRVEMVDCNRHSLTGKLEEKVLKGWGYSYYVLEDVGEGISTKMACPGGQLKEEFVPVYTATLFDRYNSKLPIVVYTQKDVQVRYRIWNASNVYEVAETK